MERAGEGISITTSRHFSEWLAGIGSSIAFSTYQAAKLFLVGLNADGSICVFERTFERAMAIGVFPGRRSFMLSTYYQFIRFDEVLPKDAGYDEFDVLFAPHQTWITGDVDAHDVAVLSDGTPLFVNTMYSCLATVSPGYSFKPIWRPPFISRLAPEDRCHLNGMALEGGKPRYVTLVAASDVTDGWRDRKADGGLLWDIAAAKPVAEGLSMPHSPQLHKGRIWLLNAGTGDLGFVDGDTGRFHAVAFCPGYARGLAIVGRYAIVGISHPRIDGGFRGLPLDDALAKRGAEPRCGLIVVDLETGDTVAWLRMEGATVRELFGVVVLPGIRKPALIGLRTNEVHRIVAMDESEMSKS